MRSEGRELGCLSLEACDKERGVGINEIKLQND
jgi:hypothetical protein